MQIKNLLCKSNINKRYLKNKNNDNTKKLNGQCDNAGYRAINNIFSCNEIVITIIFIMKCNYRIRLKSNLKTKTYCLNFRNGTVEVRL